MNTNKCQWLANTILETATTHLTEFFQDPSHLSLDPESLEEEIRSRLMGSIPIDAFESLDVVLEEPICGPCSDRRRAALAEYHSNCGTGIDPQFDVSEFVGVDDA